MEIIDPDSFDEGGCDLDGVCIRARLMELAARSLAGDRDPDSDGWEDWLDEAGRCIDALIAGGALRREWFAWDESTHSVVHAGPDA